MGKPNGGKPVQRLSAALHDCIDPPGRGERIAELAAALQDCIDSAVETGSQIARQEAREDMAGIKETLRMIWKQCGGSPKRHLPIDGRIDQ